MPDTDIPLEQELLDWFSDSRKAFYQRQIAMIFEDKFPHYKTVEVLRELENGTEWINKEKEYWGGKPVCFYYHKEAPNIGPQKDELKWLMRQLDGDRKGEYIGNRAKEVVERTLSRLNFRHMCEDCQKYYSKEWKEDDRDLDLIMEYKGQGFGIEVKNRNEAPQKDSIQKKMEICRQLDLKLIFASRYLPPRFRYWLKDEGHHWINFRFHLIPPYFEELFDTMQDTEGFRPSNEKVLRPSVTRNLLKPIITGKSQRV